MECKNVLDRVVDVGGKIVVGERQKSLSQMNECCVLQKVRVIVSEDSHILANQYKLLLS